MLPIGRFCGLMADNHTNTEEIIVQRGAKHLHGPLLQLPGVVGLPHPCPAVLAGVLHGLGLDIVAAVGQILPTVDCDRPLWLWRSEVLESGRWWRRRLRRKQGAGPGPI